MDMTATATLIDLSEARAARLAAELMVPPGLVTEAARIYGFDTADASVLHATIEAYSMPERWKIEALGSTMQI